MLIFGTNRAKLKFKRADYVQCDKCKKSDKIVFGIMGEYFHVWYVPAFPVRKTGFAVCGNCDAKYGIKNMPVYLKSKFNEVLKSTKHKWWEFSLIYVFVFIAVSLFISLSNNKNKNLEYLASPIVQDVYHYKMIDFKGNFTYSSYLVDSITTDSVYVIPNNFMTDLPSQINSINKLENFSLPPITFSRKDLLKMYEEGEITNVIR